MAPIRRSRRTSIIEDEDLLDDYGELYTLINIHEKEIREITDRLRIHYQHLEVEMQRRLHQASSGEGSSQSSATRVQPQLTTCLNCKTLLATMVCYPCRHLSVCFECDTKVSECPLCKKIKLSSFMSNQSSI